MTSQIRSRHVPMAESRLGATKASARLTTTLYDVVAALQAVTEPDQDHLAIAVIVHWLRSGRLTSVRGITLTAETGLTA